MNVGTRELPVFPLPKRYTHPLNERDQLALTFVRQHRDTGKPGYAAFRKAAGLGTAVYAKDITDRAVRRLRIWAYWQAMGNVLSDHAEVSVREYADLLPFLDRRDPGGVGPLCDRLYTNMCAGVPTYVRHSYR